MKVKISKYKNISIHGIPLKLSSKRPSFSSSFSSFVELENGRSVKLVVENVLANGENFAICSKRPCRPVNLRVKFEIDTTFFSVGQ